MKNENETIQKGKVTSFPGETLASSIDLVSQIVKSRGETSVSVKDIALITGMGEGSLPLPISACNQYRILQNKFGSGYQSTDLFHKIQMPTYEHEKTMAIFEALSSPPLYKRIISDFNGKVLPDEKGFSNYLVKEFQFKAYAIPKIVKAFFENFKEYGAIDSNNKLRFIAPSSSSQMAVETKQESTTKNEVDVHPPKKKEVENNLHEQSIPLTDGEKAILFYPKGRMKAKDFEALEMFIKLIKLTEGIHESDIQKNGNE